MSKEQYDKTRLFASILKSFDEECAEKSFSFLVDMVNNLKAKDYVKFGENRNHFIENVNKLSNENKVILNTFFESIGAEERV